MTPRSTLVAAAAAFLMLGCGGDGSSYGSYVATISIGGDCGRTETRGADVEVFGRSVIVTFYTPDDFEECVGGYGWSWDGNLDSGMAQFVAGPCLLGLGVDFPPQDVPTADRAFSSIRDNADGTYTIYGGTGAIENSSLSGYVCQGSLQIELR